MAYEFKLPDLGEGLTEGEVARWLVTEGQEVAEDDPLVEIQTDKATVEIPSPAAGVVSRIFVAEGEVVPVGTILVAIGGDASGEPAAVEQPVAAAAAERARATPLVRKVAQELGVDIDGLAGTGPQGRITEEDVRQAAGAGGQTSEEGRSEPLRGVRRVIAEHMARAHREVPPVTWVEECDFEAVDMEKLVATVVKACADELQAFPELNARLAGDAIVYLDRYDVGVAVQTAQGLMVPVVRGCDAKTVDEIHAELASLAERARDGYAGAGGAPRLDVHGHERRQARRPLPDADRQPPRGGDPLHRPNRAQARGSRRCGRRPTHGNGRTDVRPPGDRRRAGCRVRPGRHRPNRVERLRGSGERRSRPRRDQWARPGRVLPSRGEARARSLGLAGWVRNRPDGAVEAVFEGPQEPVESMLRWCEQGPAGARVDAVDVTWEQPVGDEGFEVR